MILYGLCKKPVKVEVWTLNPTIYILKKEGVTLSVFKKIIRSKQTQILKLYI